jgi:CPA2 family monovalent cation:H+ antiporter-2
MQYCHMPHETTLIALIAIGFVAALAFGWLATRLRLPPLVGYLVAGMAIGPFTPGFVGDSALAQQLAEIGVILLMFGVGLHFSVSSLWEARRVALPGAVVQILVATGIGAGVAMLWGWSLTAGLVFGLALSVASTVVLLRALEQRNELNTEQGRIAVGWLIVEDLAMVLALVFLPALAPTPDGAVHDARELALTIGLTAVKVGVFVALMLVGGRRVVPWLLLQISHTRSRELFTLAVLAIALGIAYGSAALFDVSFALGAFFAGVLLAESDLSHQAAENSLPLQDAFAVLFFVSVGMLFDPSIVVTEPLAVLAVLAIVIVGKSLAAFAIVLALGYPARTALTISASLAQIGEFSFILAGLGVALGLLPHDGRNLVLAGALLSIALNPFVFATVVPVNNWLGRHPRLLGAITRRRMQAAAPVLAALDELREHAIVVGYGRVGSLIGTALQKEGLPYAVIERNPRVFDTHLRSAGIPAVAGDATLPGVLESVHVERARLLVIASPDGYHARQVLAQARARNPQIATIVRTHSAAERDFLEGQGVNSVVMGEHELAMTMAAHALQRLRAG